MAVVTVNDPVAAECPMVSGQDCYRSPYSPEGYSECGGTWNAYTSVSAHARRVTSSTKCMV